MYETFIDIRLRSKWRNNESITIVYKPENKKHAELLWNVLKRFLSGDKKWELY